MGFFWSYYGNFENFEVEKCWSRTAGRDIVIMVNDGEEPITRCFSVFHLSSDAIKKKTHEDDLSYLAFASVSKEFSEQEDNCMKLMKENQIRI